MNLHRVSFLESKLIGRICAHSMSRRGAIWLGPETTRTVIYFLFLYIRICVCVSGADLDVLQGGVAILVCEQRIASEKISLLLFCLHKSTHKEH